jgi:glycosyltransferase involved in cell wall biosynthesis
LGLYAATSIEKVTMNKIWIDVTDYLKWNRPPTGIIRVEHEIIKWSLENLKNVHFFRYDSKGRFIPVDLTNKFSNKDSKVSHSFFFKTSTMDDFKIFSYQILRASHQLLLSFINARYHFRLNNFIKNSIQFTSKNHFPLRRHVKHSLVHPFQEGDVILCSGMTWNYHTINDDIASIKKAITIFYYAFCHDIASIKFPHLCLVDQYPFLQYFRKLAQTANHVFCISKCTENDFKNFVLEQRLPCISTSIITEGVTILQKPSEISPSMKNILEDEFILYVSTIERRKNHECIYKAVLHLLESGYQQIPKIIFVGMKGWGVADLLKDLSLDPRVKDYFFIFSDLSDDDLSCLYRKALFTVYPSYYEGWGLPVGESLAYGKMAIVSSAASLPEVGGDYVDYVNPYDIIGWANKIQFYLDNRGELSKREQYIKQNYVVNTWRDFCAGIYNVVKKN